MRSITLSAMAITVALGLSPTVFAQERDDAASNLARRLRTGDHVWVEISTTDVRTGRVLGVADGALRLEANGVVESIPISTIWRVQRKQNGIVLGTLIGAGVGLTLGWPLADIGANEGTGVASPLLFMTGVGAAAGAGIDLFLWRKRTVYTYQEGVLVIRPILGPNRVGVFVSKAFGGSQRPRLRP